jgi:hypothetical protein
VFTIQDGPAPMPLMVALRGAKRLIDGNQDAISGILAYGTPISYTYQLTNDGDLPLIITGWSETLRTNLAPLAPTFSAAFPQTLAPGASVTMTVPVNPVASGVWRVGFSFTTNEAASPFDFSLIGNAASTASSGSVNDSYQGTAGNTACGSGGFAGLLLGIGALALGLRRRRR